MKLAGFLRLKKEDVDEQFRPLVDKIGFSINNFAEQVLNALNKKLTITDNLNQELKELTLTMGASGAPTESIQFKNELGINIKGMIVARVENVTNPSSYPATAPFVTWDETNFLVTVKNITGLTSGNKYKIRLITIGN
jgi:hypothetical protein